MTRQERDILQAVHDAGVTLTVDRDRLRYQAPAGALTSDLQTDLQEIMADLLYEYHERAGILEYGAHLPRAEAEARAAEMVLGTDTN